LKRYFPAEFMAAVLTNGKGFYHPIVYVLECHRLGLKLSPPSTNEPGPAFVPQGNSIRVPLTLVKGLTTRTKDAILDARERGPFESLADFFHRVAPAGEELEAMIRVGAFDEFGETRTRQFWQAQHLLKTYGAGVEPNQGWLIPPPGWQHLPGIPAHEPAPSPLPSPPMGERVAGGRVRGRFMVPTHVQFLEIFPLHEPSRRECLEWET